MNDKPRDLQAVPPQYIGTYAVEDEISLVDIWIILTKFKKLFLVSMSLLIVIGILLVNLLLGEKYQVSSVINTGMIVRGNVNVPIVSPSAVVTEINTSIMPELTKSYAEKYGMGLFTTSVSNPRGTNLIVIENRVEESNRAAIAEFQQEIVSRIISDHQKLYDVMSPGLKQGLAQERKVLSEIVNPLKLGKLTEALRLKLQLESQALARLTDKALQASNLQGIRDKIKFAEDSILAYSQQNEALMGQINLENASESSKDKGDIRANIAENRLAINDLQTKNIALKQRLERFEFELGLKTGNKKIEIQELETSIKIVGDNLNDQIILQKEKLKALELQLANEGSRASAVAELSLKPVGLTRLKAIVLVIVLSVIGAFMITLIAIFRQKVREKAADGG
jgi:hypothetical protein